MKRRTAILVALLLIPALSWAEDEIERFAKHAKGPTVAQLVGAGAAKALAHDPATRRKFILETAKLAPPQEAALPLALHLCESEDDDKNRVGAWKIVAHIGVACDRDDVRARILPDVRRHETIQPAGPEERGSLEELVRLGKWFRLDKEIARDLEAIWKGEDFNLRSVAFEGICDLQDGALENKLVRPACQQVLAATKGYSLFDRRRAIRELAKRNDHTVVPIAAAALTGDGPTAVDSAYALADLRDPRALDALRKIDRSAAHPLREAAFFARARLDDASLADELAAWLDDDNGPLLAKMIEALGETRSPKVKPLLVALAKGKYPEARGTRLTLLHKEDEVAKERALFARSAAIALLARGDEPGLELIATLLADDKADKNVVQDVATKAMKSTTALADELVVLVLSDARYGEAARTLAAARAGEHRLKNALEVLGQVGLADGEPGGLRLEALASRVELQEPASLGDFAVFLDKYDDTRRKDEGLEIAGEKSTIKRYAGSSIFGLLDRLDRKGDDAVLPLIETLLQPQTIAAVASPAAAEAKPGTTTSGPKPSTPAALPLDARPRRAKDPFVRRRAVEVAAKLGGEKAAKILGRAMADPRSEVRAAALREIGRLSSKFALAAGDPLADEEKATKPALAWLKERSAWPPP